MIKNLFSTPESVTTCSSFAACFTIAAPAIVALLVGVACAPAIAQIALYRPHGQKMEKFTCPTFKQESDAQEAAYYRSEVETPWGYTIDRSLRHYKLILSSDFDRDIESLGPAMQWLDIGAGMGNAILDYVSPSLAVTQKELRKHSALRAKAVAISIEDRRTARWHQTEPLLEANKIKYLYGRRLREYSLQELGSFKVISDVAGGFTYTDNLSRFMEGVLTVLERHGAFYTVLQDVNREKGSSRPYRRNAPFLTELVNGDGSEVKVCAWLKSITCVEVTCEMKTGISPPVEAYRIRKVCNDFSVPGMEQISFEAGAPPGRRFQLRNTTQTLGPVQN